MVQISVIVPVYNAVKCLRRCIDSILAQTFTDFELLLIDDGSTDGSGAICDEYALKDTRVVVFHKENGGVSSARNVGLDEAKGEWITFCDADDKVLPDWLGIFIRNQRDSDLVVQSLLTDRPLYDYVDKRKTHYGCDYSGSVEECLLKLEKDYAKGFVYVRLFRKELIDRYHLRFNERFSYQEDLEFCFRYMIHCKNMNCSSEAGYFYFVPDSSKYSNISYFFELFKSLYLSSKTIFKDRKNSITEYYLDRLTMALMETFKKKATDRKTKLRTYKKTIGMDVFYTRLFPLTKAMIFIDVTCCLSYITLCLHVKLKS